VKKLADLEAKRGAETKDETLDQDAEDIAHILLDQALLAEGQKFVKPADFIQRLNRQLAK